MKRDITVESLGKYTLISLGTALRKNWKIARRVMAYSISVFRVGHYEVADRSKFLSEVHYIFFHNCANSDFNSPIWLVGLQVIRLKLSGNFLIGKLKDILEMKSN